MMSAGKASGMRTKFTRASASGVCKVTLGLRRHRDGFFVVLHGEWNVVVCVKPAIEFRFCVGIAVSQEWCGVVLVNCSVVNGEGTVENSRVLPQDLVARLAWDLYVANCRRWPNIYGPRRPVVRCGWWPGIC